MSKIDVLLRNYIKTIGIPWRDIAAAQRVIFAVHDKTDELKIRAKLGDFEIATKNSEDGKHGWAHFDITNSFAEWMHSLKYANSYYQKPQLLGSIIKKYGDFIEKKFVEFLQRGNLTNEDVVALSGVGTVFGFIKVSELVDRLAPKFPGRLLVFFPGSYSEMHNYQLLDGYDGWNYHAIPITCDREI